MKIMGVFSNGFLIGRVYNGRGYVRGIDIGPCPGKYSVKPVNVKSLKVHKKMEYGIINVKGEVMRLVKREGGVAVVQDEYGIEHIAVLHNTFYSEALHKMLTSTILITEVERKTTSPGNKKRWILL